MDEHIRVDYNGSISRTVKLPIHRRLSSKVNALCNVPRSITSWVPMVTAHYVTQVGTPSVVFYLLSDWLTLN